MKLAIMWKDEMHLVRRSDDGCTLFWDNGSWCSWPWDAEIIKEYPDEVNAWRSFYIDFPPRIAEPSNEDYAGWISPGGKFYPCGWCEHDSTAEKITASLFQSLDGTYMLGVKGWVRVETNGYCHFDEYSWVTQSQFDVLWDLWMTSELGVYKDKLESQMQEVKVK